LNHALNTLRKAKNNNKLTIFVGAGISKSANLPSWDELIANIKADLSISESENDYLKIAQLYYLSCGESAYYQNLRQYFPNSVQPTIIHKLIFELKPKNIVTTNWDILLEKSAQNNGFIYDIISKDEHLVLSELENYIIKMHGDFESNNIVFKEDDYINYENNFPLISNYIKSILSTNTILFLGYSYSDINLKHIVKWLQNNSAFMPSMFLISFIEDKNQIKYLENFGITTLLLTDENSRFKLDSSYSNKLATFLDKLNSSKNWHDDLNTLSDLHVVNIVYEKLKPLDELNAILLKQIQTTLTNCGFTYQAFIDQLDKISNLTFLTIYDKILTGDFNKEIRELYNKFRVILNNSSNNSHKEIANKINVIMLILRKANIDGYIKTPDNDTKEFSFFKVDRQINYIENLLYNFNFDNDDGENSDINSLMQAAFFQYQKYQYQQAYKVNSRVIELCLEQKNYTKLFLAMFNHNVLLIHLKSTLHNFGKNKQYRATSEAWQYQIKSYDLNEKYYELPKKTQQILSQTKPFISYEYLYQFSSEIEEELDKKIKQEKSIENNGTLTWDSNVTRNYSKHKNLVSFVLNNYIMIERSAEYRQINKKLIRISLIRQLKKKSFSLDKLEVYTIVKYINHKDLIDITSEFKEFQLSIDNKVLNWLILKVLPNVVSLYSEKNTIYSRFSDELKNIFYLCQFATLTSKQSKEGIQQIKALISKGRVEIDIYRSINNFILNTEKAEEKDLTLIIELMINKIICKTGNFHDYQAIEYNYLWSPFKHLNERGFLYQNKPLVKKLLNELEEHDIEQQVKISQRFLINLYHISSEEIKDLIKTFMLNIKLDDIGVKSDRNDYPIKSYGFKVSFKLFLAISEIIDVTDELIEAVKKYPEEDQDNLFFLGRITNQVKYLVEELNIEKLKELLLQLLTVVDDVNEKLRTNNTMII